MASAPAAAYETITVAMDGGVAIVTLNRPDRLNALSRQMMFELATAMKALDVDPAVRAVVLAGAGRGFSSGADLSSEHKTQHAYGTLGDAFMPAVSQVRRMTKPVIAAVNGAAAGTGASLALSADIVLAAESSYFLLAFVNIGLVPDAGASWLLPRTIGAPRFTAMAMLGKRIPGRQAAEWGMIWDCVADDKLMAEAMATARQLAAGPTKTLSLIKQLIQQSDRNDYEGQMVLEAQLQQVASHTADSQEAVRAFLEKRKPVFTGR